MRRGNNKSPLHGMPGCRDGGKKNQMVSEEEFDANWKRAFGNLGPEREVHRDEQKSS